MRVSFVGFERYRKHLLIDAGVLDPDVEAIVEKQRELDEKMERLARFLGAANA